MRYQSSLIVDLLTGYSDVSLHHLKTSAVCLILPHPTMIYRRPRRHHSVEVVDASTRAWKLLPTLQLALRANHSTVTAVFRVVSE